MNLFCAASGRVRQLAFELLDLVSKFYNSAPIPPPASSTSDSGHVFHAPVFPVILEIQMEVMQRLYSEHAVTAKLKSIAAIASRDETREDQSTWTYCLSILTKLLSGICPTSIARAWLSIGPRMKALQPEAAPREVLVNTELALGEDSENEVSFPSIGHILTLTVNYLVAQLRGVLLLVCHFHSCRRRCHSSTN